MSISPNSRLQRSLAGSFWLGDLAAAHMVAYVRRCSCSHYFSRENTKRGTPRGFTNKSGLRIFRLDAWRLHAGWAPPEHTQAPYFHHAQRFFFTHGNRLNSCVDMEAFSESPFLSTNHPGEHDSPLKSYIGPFFGSRACPFLLIDVYLHPPFFSVAHCCGIRIGHPNIPLLPIHTLPKIPKSPTTKTPLHAAGSPRSQMTRSFMQGVRAHVQEITCVQTTVVRIVLPSPARPNVITWTITV